VRFENGLLNSVPHLLMSTHVLDCQLFTQGPNDVHVQFSWQSFAAGGPVLTFAQIEVWHRGRFLYSAQLQNAGQGLGIALTGIAITNIRSNSVIFICLALGVVLFCSFLLPAGQMDSHLEVLPEVSFPSFLVA